MTQRPDHAPQPAVTRVGSADWQPEAIARRHGEVRAYLDDVFATPDMRAIAARTMDLLALAPGNAVLEVGCGTGVFLPLLARAVGPAGRVVGLDHAATFVAEARRRVAADGLAATVTVEEGDAYLSWPRSRSQRRYAARAYAWWRPPRMGLARTLPPRTGKVPPSSWAPGTRWARPWCGRAWLKYRTYSRSTRRRWASPRTGR